MIRERIEAAEVEPETIDDTLVDRLREYTHGEPQLAAIVPLRATATGPGSAWATTQTVNR
jgi:hypothetical protein